MLHNRPDYNRIQDPENLIPEDEPVFLIRAKDVNSVETVMFWANKAASTGAKIDIIEAARKQAKVMQDYQNIHGCKIPDMSPSDNI